MAKIVLGVLRKKKKKKIHRHSCSLPEETKKQPQTTAIKPGKKDHPNGATPRQKKPQKRAKKTKKKVD